MTRATFYFDLGSPYAYLTAERIEDLLGEPVLWQPVSLGAIFKATGRSSWSLQTPELRAEGMAEVERRARSYGLPAISWPDPWPTNYLFAMRVATYAFRVGRGRELVLEAFREAFVRGRDLGCPEHVLRAVAGAGLDPDAAAAAADDPEIKHALRTATEVAQELGVRGVPTIATGDALFWGDDRLDEVALVLGGNAR